MQLALFLGGDRPALVTWFVEVAEAAADEGEVAEGPAPIDMRFKLSKPESSGNVSFRIPGGEKRMEASLDPTKLLLGVSGLLKLSSRVGQLAARLLRALLFEAAPDELKLVVFRVGEKFSLSVAALLLGLRSLPPYPLSWNAYIWEKICHFRVLVIDLKYQIQFLPN